MTYEPLPSSAKRGPLRARSADAGPASPDVAGAAMVAENAILTSGDTNRSHGDSPVQGEVFKFRLPWRDGIIFRLVSAAFWWMISVGLFAALWEGAWALGWINPLLLPPPHIFLQNFVFQGRFFSPATR